MRHVEGVRVNGDQIRTDFWPRYIRLFVGNSGPDEIISFILLFLLLPLFVEVEYGLY